MFEYTDTFSSFSVDDIAKAKHFYGETLNLTISEENEMMNLLTLHLAGGTVVIYPKGDDHTPASFTILNFVVADIDRAVEMLKSKGIRFERYDDEAYNMDEKSISRGTGPEPDIAWFKDPAGNILSILQEQ